MEPPSTTNRQWYVVLCHSGRERRVKTAIELRVLTLEITDLVFRVAVPPRVNARPHPSEQALLDRSRGRLGYVLVEMIMEELPWHVVRNAPGVIGFIADERNKPLPVP
jgi:transcriptional antiterminator NusG